MPQSVPQINYYRIKSCIVRVTDISHNKSHFKISICSNDISSNLQVPGKTRGERKIYKHLGDLPVEASNVAVIAPLLLGVVLCKTFPASQRIIRLGIGTLCKNLFLENKGSSSALTPWRRRTSRRSNAIFLCSFCLDDGRG